MDMAEVEVVSGSHKVYAMAPFCVCMWCRKYNTPWQIYGDQAKNNLAGLVWLYSWYQGDQIWDDHVWIARPVTGDHLPMGHRYGCRDRHTHQRHRYMADSWTNWIFLLEEQELGQNFQIVAEWHPWADKHVCSLKLVIWSWAKTGRKLWGFTVA